MLPIMGRDVNFSNCDNVELELPVWVAGINRCTTLPGLDPTIVTLTLP